MLFDGLIMGYARQNVLRAFSSILAIFVATSIAVAVMLIRTATVSSFKTAVDAVDEGITLHIVAARDGFNETLLASIRSIDSVVEAEPRTQDVLRVAPALASQAPEDLRVVGVDAMQNLPQQSEIRAIMPGPFVSTGSDPTPSQLIFGRGAIISADLARRRTLTVGSYLVGVTGTRRIELKIAGILPDAYTGITQWPQLQIPAQQAVHIPEQTFCINHRCAPAALIRPADVARRSSYPT